MEAQIAKKSRRKDSPAFLDPGMVNEVLIRDYPADVEEYVLNAFLKLQHMSYILLQYGFEYVFFYLFVHLFLYS